MSPHPTWSLLGCALLAASAYGAGCSSSSTGGGGGVDAGHSSSSGGSDDASASEGGGAGSDASDASVCKVPAGAEMMTQTEAGFIGCTAVTSNTLCDPQFRLICRSPDPITGVPVPPSSLGCQLQANGDPTVAIYCCPCQ